jgi:hypothetical protein
MKVLNPQRGKFMGASSLAFLSGEVARLLGKHATSRAQLVAEVRQFLTRQL